MALVVSCLMASLKPLRQRALSTAFNLVRCQSTLPGKLGDPTMTLLTEPRLNQAILKDLKNDVVMGYGLLGKPVPMPFKMGTPVWMLHPWNTFLEKYVVPIYMPDKKRRAPNVSGIEQFTEVIKGIDGNDIVLYIAKPKNASTLPGILHMHGGGMMVLSANDHKYRTWRTELASQGCFAVVSVEFRNSSGQLGCHPYPAGLNDCMSSLSWTHANREKLGISKIILSGESGGGNLCTAMALRAKQEGELHKIGGVFAYCPLIAGPEDWKARTLTSIAECDGYYINLDAFLACVTCYDPEGKYDKDPCAWPLTATRADVEGLPPHFIVVNELDPLRDEGLAYYQKLKDAGVRAEKKISKGTPHGGQFLCYDIPGAEHLYDEAIQDMKAFADSL